MNVNYITILLAGIFLIPIFIGMLEPFSRYKIKYSLSSLFNSIEFLVGILLSMYLTNRIFFENESGIFKTIYQWIPVEIKLALKGKVILTYLAAGPVVLLIILLILRIFSNPLYDYLFEPLTDGICSFIERRGRVFKRVFGAVWQLPRAIYFVFIAALLLNFSSYYFDSPLLSRWMNESSAYQTLYKNALYPVLNSTMAKRIPVIVNDSFRNTFGRVIPKDNGTGEPSNSKPNFRVIEYFNGVTLEEAVKSTPEIDATAKRIVGNEQNSRTKEYLIYKWISKNIKYDYEKAEQISKDATGISSGSRIAFETRKGICFDYSCLYISMCRAVGVKVRLITGLGYSGVSWGDHAWNQSYSNEDGKWLNVDSTFGTSANYFDKPDFSADHKYAELQGEWDK